MDWSRLPSLAALRAFDALARNGTLSAAARELNVTHAAISQHLRGLETHIGEVLAQRDGQIMRLTPVGEELAAALSEGFGTINSAVTTILDRHVLRPVKVSLTPSFAESWLMPRLGAFWQAHPEVEVHLIPSMELVDLRRDGIDVALRFGDGEWPGVDVAPLALDPFVVVAGPEYTAARKLDDFPDLRKPDWFFSRAAREQRIWGKAIGVDFDVVGAQEMATNSLVLSAVRAGLGLSIQSRALVKPDLDNGQLVALYEGDPEGLGYYIVTQPGLLSPGTETFLRWLKRAAKAS